MKQWWTQSLVFSQEGTAQSALEGENCYCSVSAFSLLHLTLSPSVTLAILLFFGAEKWKCHGNTLADWHWSLAGLLYMFVHVFICIHMNACIFLIIRVDFIPDISKLPVYFHRHGERKQKTLHMCVVFCFTSNLHPEGCGLKSPLELIEQLHCQHVDQDKPVWSIWKLLKKHIFIQVKNLVPCSWLQKKKQDPFLPVTYPLHINKFPCFSC